ncbi:hypothetical protein BDZ97DRAFT_1836218, partial [Flammula alnicola]
MWMTKHYNMCTIYALFGVGRQNRSSSVTSRRHSKLFFLCRSRRRIEARPNARIVPCSHSFQPHDGQHNNLGWHLIFNWTGVAVFLFVVIDWALGKKIRRP